MEKNHLKKKNVKNIKNIIRKNLTIISPRKMISFSSLNKNMLQFSGMNL